MIDWPQTISELGYGPEVLISKRPKVICRCDTCNKAKTISIRIKKTLISEQMAWLCPACVCKLRSDKISKQLKRQWADPTYCAKRKASSEKSWEDENYKSKHALSIKSIPLDPNLSTKLRARYEDPAAREKLRQSSLSMWSQNEFRAKHKAIMARPEIRLAQSLAATEKWKSDDYRSKMATIRSEQSRRPSSIQHMLYKTLDDMNIEYHREGPETKIGWYVFDCAIPSTNGKKLLIECQGDYWHSLENTQIRDKQKFTYISKYFPDHKIVYLLEREFYQPDKIRSKLAALTGAKAAHALFDFKNVIVSKLDSHGCTKEFLNLYHYLGPGRGGIRINATFQNEMIGVALFSTKLRQNIKFPNDSLELSRFCIHPNYHKKNFASWFLSRCAKLIPDTLFYAYSDSTVGHDGTIYKAAGWKEHHKVPPDYWYIDHEGFVMHKKTLYNRAQNLKLTESEFATKYEYRKIVGGDKTCYILSR